MLGEKRQHTRRNSPFTSLSYRQLMQVRRLNIIYQDFILHTHLWRQRSIRQRASSPLGIVVRSHAKIAYERRRDSEGRQLAGVSLRLPWLNARRLAVLSTNETRTKFNSPVCCLFTCVQRPRPLLRFFVLLANNAKGGPLGPSKGS